MDDYGKRLDAVAQGTSDGVAGHELDFHSGVGDVRVDFHGAPSPLTLNLRLGQDPNKSAQSLPYDTVTPGVEISHVGIGDTSFHAGYALGRVDSRLPLQGAYGLVLGVTGVSHANVDSHDAAVKDSNVSFKVINFGLLASDQGLCFMTSKNKGVNLDSSKKVVNVAGGLKKVQDSIKKVQDFGTPSFAQMTNSTTRDKVPLMPDPQISNIALESSKPTLKGNYVCVKVNEKALKNRLELCQYSLIGRIFLSKGDSTWKLADLKFKLQSIWQLSSDWWLISLGHGFFHILLTSSEEKARVWSMRLINLKPSVLHLEPWHPNFNLNTQRSTNT
ncbi:hypothetical protein PanWU01x14_290520 [Parasponia andersonii]|uniref:DUF4283 domain-containing protein n=1 Tax=Parasponia andersonii TaxID=3476 RepID=A0A2P5AXP0_PARAD|nr:hypothetical protein PanWU01x14_290520 [Parasponia andersonii]